jgi:hypothetical protein
MQGLAAFSVVISAYILFQFLCALDAPALQLC